MEWLEEKIKEAKISERKISPMIYSRLKNKGDCLSPETKLTESEINLILRDMEIEFGIKVDLDEIKISEISTCKNLYEILAELILMNPYSYSAQE